MNNWCKHIVAKTVTADFIKSIIGDIHVLESNYIKVKNISIQDGAYYNGHEIANKKWARDTFAYKNDIPTLHTTKINGVTVYCP